MGTGGRTAFSGVDADRARAFRPACVCVHVRVYTCMFLPPPPGVKPFKCALCEYATRSKSNLKAHMNRHSTEKTHLCDMCGKKFKSKGTLKSHKLLHTADGE